MLTSAFRVGIVGMRHFAMSTVQKPEVVFILGGPGAGKGTLCRYIVEKYGYQHLSAGDLLREERANPNSEFGELIENHMKNGTIVPVEITCNLLKRAMDHSKDQSHRFLIDGFPRNQDNVDGWTKILADQVILKGVLSLECNLETCNKRCLNRGAMGSGRPDDNLECLRKRHETHIEQTLPIIEFYQGKGLVYKIDSTKSPDDVLTDVEQILPEMGW